MYVFKTGNYGAERLAAAQATYGEESQYLLRTAGIKPGMQVVDVGCGTGGMLLWLSEQAWVPRINNRNVRWT